VAIASDDELLSGLSKMWTIMMDETGWKTEVFKKRDAVEIRIKEMVKKRFGIEDLLFETIRLEKRGPKKIVL